MKLLQELLLLEMPFKIKAFPELSDDQIKWNLDSLEDAEFVEKIEIDYELIKNKDNKYALRKDGVIMGFAATKIVKFFNKSYIKVEMIYTIPKYRSQQIGKILMHGIKEVVELPLICDDVVSDGGFKLMASMIKLPSIFRMTSMNLKNGDIRDFKTGDESNDKLAIIVENKNVGLFREGLLIPPGERMYLKFLD